VGTVRKIVLCALLSLVALLAITTALAGERANIPDRYRYAGVVEDGRGVPTHYARAGEGFRFYFYDSLSRGLRSAPYTLCVGQPGKAPARCWSRVAKFGVGKFALSATLPQNVPLGPLTARWLLAGRTVATWPFLYVHGD
jgi:hypothetical protein